jgi:methylglutaconyl-CoA hydratase
MAVARVDVERNGPVASVWIDRGEVRNAFDGATVRALHEAVRAVSGRDDVRAVVIGGRGPCFCAGADLQWMRTAAGFTHEENLADARALADLFLALDACPKPVVARVHGAALGGGAGLVATADLAVAAAGTQFGFTEVRLGLVPSVIAPYVLRKIGEAAARELFLTGERFDAAKARTIGLVQTVVPEGELDAAVEGRVRELLQGAPGALAAAKRLIRDVAGRAVEDVRELTVERIAERRSSAEGREGVAAFLERRGASWKP